MSTFYKYIRRAESFDTSLFSVSFVSFFFSFHSFLAVFMLPYFLYTSCVILCIFHHLPFSVYSVFHHLFTFHHFPFSLHSFFHHLFTFRHLPFSVIKFSLICLRSVIFRFLYIRFSFICLRCTIFCFLCIQFFFICWRCTIFRFLYSQFSLFSIISASRLVQVCACYVCSCSYNTIFPSPSWALSLSLSHASHASGGGVPPLPPPPPLPSHHHPRTGSILPLILSESYHLLPPVWGTPSSPQCLPSKITWPIQRTLRIHILFKVTLENCSLSWLGSLLGF